MGLAAPKRTLAVAVGATPPKAATRPHSSAIIASAERPAQAARRGRVSAAFSASCRRAVVQAGPSRRGTILALVSPASKDAASRRSTPIGRRRASTSCASSAPPQAGPGQVATFTQGTRRLAPIVPGSTRGGRRAAIIAGPTAITPATGPTPVPSAGRVVTAIRPAPRLLASARPSGPAGPGRAVTRCAIVP